MGFLLYLCAPGSALSFESWDNNGNSGEADLMLRGLGMTWRNPEDTSRGRDRTESGGGLLGRLIIDGSIGATIDYKLNLYQTWLPASLAGGNATVGAALDVERSAALEHSFSNDDYAHLALDSLLVNWSWQDVSITLGRQPINLATTFYFSPNDMFAPFAAQAFYRVYKPGVDALRGEYRVNEFSSVSLISVLGYQQTPGSATGWSRQPDSDRLSHLLRYSAVFGDSDIALLGGKVRRAELLGAAWQTEVLEWLGIRGEAHYAESRDSVASRYYELSLGVEHRFENSLDARLEWFRHGSGADNTDDYNTMVIAPGSPAYLGRHYLAAGASYELTPLLNGQALLAANLIDRSSITAISILYSLSDEAELSAGLTLPRGKRAHGGVLRSEYGNAPILLNLELRQYF